MEGLSAAFCGVVLLMLSAVGAATVLIQGGRQSRVPVQRAAPPVVDDQPRRARVTFLMDNPWYNLGEAIDGMITRRDDRSFVFHSDADPEASYIIPDDPAQVQIELFRAV